MQCYQFPTPLESSVTLELDSGESITGISGVYKGRSGYSLLLPASYHGTIGARLTIDSAGYRTFSARGMLVPAVSEALFCLDDVALEEAPPPAPEPPVIYQGSPEEIINQVWATGDHELETKEGCGLFVEACCTALHDSLPDLWGHIRKTGAQNQWNGHAVDAVQCLTGADMGIWDIIHDSESANATPEYIYKGEPAPDLWYYPA